MAVTSPAFARDRSTLLLYAALGVFGCLQVVPGLVTPALRDELGYGYTLASLHVSAFAGLGVVAGIAAPALDRRYGRRALLVVGLVGLALAAGALTLGRTPTTTLAAAGVAGLLGTLVLVAVQSALSDHHGEQRAVAFAESNVVASLGQTGAPIVVGAAAAVLGSWRWGVVALAATGLLVALAARGRAVPSLLHDGELTDAGGPLPSAARTGVALVFASVALEWSVSYWGATYLREVVGLARATAVAAMACFFGAMLVGRFASGLLVRRHHAARLMAYGLVVVAAGVMLQGVSTATVPALAGLLLLGLGIAALFPLGLALAVGAAPLRSTAVSGRCVVAGSGAVLLGPLVVGQVADGIGLRPALVAVPVLAVVATALLVRLVHLQPVGEPTGGPAR